jgi:hypothetical protein
MVSDGGLPAGGALEFELHDATSEAPASTRLALARTVMALMTP